MISLGRNRCYWEQRSSWSCWRERSKYDIINSTDLLQLTWLQRCQSLLTTTVLFGTTFNRMIILDLHIIILTAYLNLTLKKQLLLFVYFYVTTFTFGVIKLSCLPCAVILMTTWHSHHVISYLKFKVAYHYTTVRFIIKWVNLMHKTFSD